MASCDFCKINSNKGLKSCVCGKVSYCSKECQVKDWKTHKPSCPPFVVRESPGKGRGLFATRRIKEGQIILEEYPLLTYKDGTSLKEFKANHYPTIDEDTKRMILQLNDPAESFETLDTDTVQMSVRKHPIVGFWRESRTDEISKIFRIITVNARQICGEEELYNPTELGLYNNHSLINHSCVPNATSG